MELKQKTNNLIKRLNLKPATNESLYSQSFIERERNVVKRIKELSVQKIEKQQNKSMEKRTKLAELHSSILHRKLGLKPKLTVNQQLNEWGAKKRPKLTQPAKSNT